MQSLFLFYTRGKLRILAAVERTLELNNVGQPGQIGTLEHVPRPALQGQEQTTGTV